MDIYKMYKDASIQKYQKVTDLDREFELLQIAFEDVEKLMFDGSEFQTRWAYYKVLNIRTAAELSAKGEIL
jgi:hypothetical protein